MKKQKVILGNIYRPPLDTIDNSKNLYLNLLFCLDKRNTDVIIGGDLNIDFLKIN